MELPAIIRTDTSSTLAAPPKEWHVVLMPSTFGEEDETVEDSSVVEALVATLGIDRGRADKMVQDAKAGEQVVVEAHEAMKEALSRAELFRDKGLVVRVTTRPSKDASPGAISSRVRSHARVCGGPLRSDLHRLANCRAFQRAASPRPPQRDLGWRQELELPVLPDDPVQDFFQRERAATTAKSSKPAKRSVSQRVQAVILGHKGVDDAATSQVRAALLAPLDAAPKRVVFEAPGVPELKPTSLNQMVGNMISKKNISPAWKEACKLMRTFIFDDMREGFGARHEQDDAYDECMGTRALISTLHSTWVRLDKDHSGRVDIKEFRSFAEESLEDRLRRVHEEHDSPFEVRKVATAKVQQFVQNLCSKVERLLLEKKVSFCIDDVMRMLWPGASAWQLKTMKEWVRELMVAAEREKLPPPPVLPQEDFEGLRSLFRVFDKKCRGTLKFEELVGLGVIYDYQLERYRQEWDRNGDGRLDMREFCEMMCPVGFRAHPHSKVGSLADGRRVLFDPQLEYWRLEDGADELDWGWL